MFSGNATSDMPEVQRENPVRLVKLCKLLKTKKALIDLLKSVVTNKSMNVVELNNTPEVIESMNNMIQTIVLNINSTTLDIVDEKTTVRYVFRSNSLEFQRSVFTDFICGNSSTLFIKPFKYGLSGLAEHSKYGSVDVPDSLSELVDLGERYYSTNDELYELFDDERIVTIANNVFNVLYENYLIDFVQLSPFVKEWYMKCLKAVVVCVPLHDMKNFKEYVKYFVDRETLANHLMSVFDRLFGCRYVSTNNEWKDEMLTIPFTDTVLDNDKVSRFTFPHDGNMTFEDEKENKGIRYDVGMMMTDVLGKLVKLYVKNQLDEDDVENVDDMDDNVENNIEDNEYDDVEDNDDVDINNVPPSDDDQLPQTQHEEEDSHDKQVDE